MRQKDNPLISVIIPVYKVESYLNRCVDSVLNQSYKNIEILLVDDGSPDKCGEICDQYAEKYGNVKVIHQKNQGLSAARNTGIREAEGEFLGFVDSDDFIEEDMYQVLLQNIISSNADIAIGGIIDCYEETGKMYAQFDGEVNVYNGNEAIKSVLTNRGNVTAHVVTKLYKKTIFDKITFPIGKLYEDAYTIIDFLLACDKVVVINKGLYYYCHRGNSIVESPFGKRDMNLIHAWQENHRLILERMPELKEEIEFRYLWSCFYLLDKIYVGNKEHDEEKELLHILRSNTKNILRNAYFRKSRKIGAVVLRTNKYCYKYLCRMQMERVYRKMKERG